MLKLILFLLMSFLLIASSACNFPFQSKPTPQPNGSGDTSAPSFTRTPSPTPIPTPTFPPPMVAETLCSQVSGDEINHCLVSVRVKNLEQGSLLQIEANVLGGIIFSENEALVISEDQRTSSTNPLEIGQNETRIVQFPFIADPNEHYSGKYVIRVRGYNPDMPHLSLYEGETFIYVWIQEGSIQLLPNKDEFYAFFSRDLITESENGISYSIELEQTEQPIHGQLFVLITGLADRDNPLITVSVRGGILFDVPFNSVKGVGKRTNEMFTHGSRVLVFPFQIDQDSLDGDYIVETTIKFEDRCVLKDSPFVVNVASSMVRNQSWLSVREQNQAQIAYCSVCTIDRSTQHGLYNGEYVFTLTIIRAVSDGDSLKLYAELTNNSTVSGWLTSDEGRESEIYLLSKGQRIPADKLEGIFTQDISQFLPGRVETGIITFPNSNGQSLDFHYLESESIPLNLWCPD